MEAIDLGRSYPLAAFRELHGEVVRCRRIVLANPWGVTARDFLPEPEEGAPLTAAAALARRLRSLLERHAREAGLHRNDVEPRLFQEAQYVMTALADEVFLGLEWVGRDAWLDNLLEDQLFRTRWAGERVFEGVERFRLCERNLARRELAAVYLLALSLGFEGRYRGSAGGELEEHRRRLFEFVYLRAPAAGERRLFPQAYAHTVRMPAATPLPLHGAWLAAAAFPPPWLSRVLPYLPVILGVLALAVGGFFLLRRLRRRRPPSPPPAPERLRRSFQAGARALEELIPTPAVRDRIPRFAVLGDRGAGKSAVLAGLRLPHAFPVTPALADAGALCRWWFFHHAVVLDLPGEGEESAWRDFVRLVHRLRPARGLDGIVLAVAWPELAGPERLAPDVLAARGAAVFRRLQEAENVLKARLPVYLLLTRCDRLEGFRALVDTLAPGQRQEIFGWSSPFPADRAFEPGWVDEAVATLESELLEAGLELLAAPAPATDGDRIFRLSGELRSAAEPLRAYLGEVFRRSAYQRGCTLRGIYLTGDARADAAGEPAGEEPPAARDLVFLGDLFERKVFAESAASSPAALPFPRAPREADGYLKRLFPTGSPR